jgi:hypothetical protein
VSETEQETAQEQEQPTVEPQPAEPAEQEEEEGELETTGVPGEGEGDSDGEGEPSESPPLSEKELEKRLKSLDSEAQRHANRVKQIMGDDAAMLVPCPLCETIIPGFVMPTPKTPERFPDVRAFMGDSQPRSLNSAPDTARCQVCDGYGMVASGSRVDNQAELVCTECKGAGWVGPRAEGAKLAAVRQATPVETNGGETAQAPGFEPPEAAKLRAQGYTLIPPVGV